MSSALDNPYARNIDFGCLKGLIGNILPSDLDMIVERNKNFLAGEWKYSDLQGTGVYETTSIGQRIMLQNLALTPNFTVLRVFYKRDADDKLVIGVIERVKHGKFIRIGRGQEHFKRYYTHWWRIANG